MTPEEIAEQVQHLREHPYDLAKTKVDLWRMVLESIASAPVRYDKGELRLMAAAALRVEDQPASTEGAEEFMRLKPRGVSADYDDSIGVWCSVCRRQASKRCTNAEAWTVHRARYRAGQALKAYRASQTNQLLLRPESWQQCPRNWSEDCRSQPTWFPPPGTFSVSAEDHWHPPVEATEEL